MINPEQAEARLRQLGVIRKAEFTTATDGILANCKVEMDVMYQDTALTEAIAEQLATRLEAYHPEIIVPVPKGANRLGQVIGAIMGVHCLAIKWVNKNSKQLGYFSEATKAKAQRSTSVALIEDVSTTDGSLSAVADFLGGDKTFVGAVVWDRNPEADKRSNFPVERFIKSYVPFRIDE
jgi:orotate phosphoribosyltransferase